MPANQPLSRRNFLQTASVAASLATVVPSSVFAADDSAPNSRINMGVIGYGPRCKYDMKSMLQFSDVRFVALSEVQAHRGAEGKQAIDEHYGNADCTVYRDFREMLERKDIDAVLIATGDRWHSAASILAAQAGKDVYSEKPCGITIGACQELADTMHAERRVFQAGTQRRSVPNFETAVQMVHDGKLGKLHTLYASVYKPVLENAWLEGQPRPSKEELDWNLWLGPAPWRPYNKKYVQGGWRGQWDFDSGARLLDWGAHTVDLCQWANDADNTMPITYEPQDDKIVCMYENGVKLIIDFLPDPFGDRSPHYLTRLGTCPVRFEGDEGSVETGDEGEIVVKPTSLQKEIGDQYKRVRGLDVTKHARNFFDCLRSREKTAANQDVMRRSHIASHAAAIAWILGRKVTIDPETETFVNDDQANLLKERPWRNWAV